MQSQVNGALAERYVPLLNAINISVMQNSNKSSLPVCLRGMRRKTNWHNESSFMSNVSVMFCRNKRIMSSFRMIYSNIIAATKN